MNVPEPSAAQTRLLQIARAREAVMRDGGSMTDVLVHGWYQGAWIERSWRRCLQAGARPQDRVGFDVLPAQALRRVEEANHQLVTAARPVLEQLGRAIASTRYFAILTNREGVVVDAHGPIDRIHPRAALITRVGVDH
jgi:transcriptional regulator of acetoin/glycerol metabolism